MFPDSCLKYGAGDARPVAVKNNNVKVFHANRLRELDAGAASVPGPTTATPKKCILRNDSTICSLTRALHTTPRVPRIAQEGGRGLRVALERAARVGMRCQHQAPFVCHGEPVKPAHTARGNPPDSDAAVNPQRGQ